MILDSLIAFGIPILVMALREFFYTLQNIQLLILALYRLRRPGCV